MTGAQPKTFRSFRHQRFPNPANNLPHTLPMSEANAPLSAANEIGRRRTFAIISHPDAGKTTLTENLLLAGGAVHLAGQVKTRGENRRARSDWMKIEQDRGISVTSAVMTFNRGKRPLTFLIPPGTKTSAKTPIGP